MPSASLEERFALGLKSAAGGCSSRPKAAPQVAKRRSVLAMASTIVFASVAPSQGADWFALA